MTRQTLLTSLMLFVAAAGWVCYPPPVGTGRAAQSFVSADAVQRLRERTVPLGCAVLGLAFLAAGLRRRPELESDHERR